MKNIIFIGDIPQYNHYIDGKNMKPTDTRFRGNNNLVLYFNNIPKNIEQYIEYSVYPIHIFVDNKDKIPTNIKHQFEIVDNGTELTFQQILQNIFYNPDRKKVYKILQYNKPDPYRIHLWMIQNSVRIYKSIPNTLLTLDEYVVKMLSPNYYYTLISFGLKNSNNVKRLKWTKKDN